MKRLFLSAFCLAYASVFACDDVEKKVVLLNTVGWVGGNYENLAKMMFAPDPINAAIRQRVTDNVAPYSYNPNFQYRRNTTQQLDLLQNATIVWIYAHTSSQRIALEYFGNEDDVHTSAEAQGLSSAQYGVEEKHGMHSLRVNIDGLTYLWEVNNFEPYAEYCGLFIMGCNSDWLAENFVFGRPTFPADGDYASIGTTRSLYPSTDQPAIRLFWERMLCITSPDEVLDTYYYAANGDGYGYLNNIELLNCRIYYHTPGAKYWLAPDPCNVCHRPVSYIRDVEYSNNVIRWQLSNHEKVEEVVISGYDSGEYVRIAAVPCFADTGSVHVPKGPWSDITLHVYSNDVLMESSMPRFVSWEEATGEIRVIERDVQENGKRSLVTPSHYVVVSHVNLIQTAVTELSARFNSYAFSYMGFDDPITAEDIQQFYGEVYQANLHADSSFPYDPGPELILIGPDITFESFSWAIVPSVMIEEDGAYCDEWPIRGCRTDWLLTDINGDGHPNGPVTRIPAITHNELINALDSADLMMDRFAQDMDPLRFHTLCWDTNERYVGETQLWNSVFTELGHLSMPTLYRSEMPALPSDRWIHFAIHTDEGLDELFGAGRIADTHRWFDILWSQVPHHHLFGIERAFLAYLPSCFTGAAYINVNGYWVNPFLPNNHYQSIGISLMHNHGQEHNLKLAGMIGMKSGTTATASLVIGERLLEQRQQILDEDNPSLAMLGFRTINSLLDTHPALRFRTLQMVVLGAPVLFKPPSGYTSVEESLSDIPAALSIGTVAPNPFNPRTTFWMDLPNSGVATLAIHDLRGRLVRTLWSGQIDAGRHPMIWDGLDDRGAQAPSGVYLVRLVTAGEQRTAKITLAK